MNNKILIVIVGVVAGLIAGVSLTPMMFSGVRNGNWGMMGNNIDQHFIEQMIPHHDGAIAMANLALEKAQHSEIKTLAKEIIEAQNKEIIDMKNWYKTWFGRNVSEGTTTMMGGMMSQGGMHMGGKEDVATLNNALDFDKEFIEQMIPHHQMAVIMARMLQAGTNRPEMEQLAKNIIKSQSEEIQKMQGWYEQWYR